MTGNGSLDALQSGKKLEIRMYRICSFAPGAVVPKVELIGATCDEEALLVADTIERSAERELWDRHRLVACLPARRAIGTRGAKAVNLH
jgi:hypothetical protein